MTEPTEQEKAAGKIQVKSVRSMKLKDKPGRGGVMYDLKQTFGFIPERIIIQKVHGEHDTFILSAVLTEAELIKKREALEKMKAGTRVEVVKPGVNQNPTPSTQITAPGLESPDKSKN